MSNLKNKILTGVASFGLASGAFAGDKAATAKVQPVSKAAPSAKVAHKKAANQNKYKLKAGEVKVLDFSAKKFHGKEFAVARVFSKEQLVVLVSIPEKDKGSHFDRGYLMSIKYGVKEHVKDKNFGAYVIRIRDGDNDPNTLRAIAFLDGKQGEYSIDFDKNGRKMMIPEQGKVFWQSTKKDLEDLWKRRYKEVDKVTSITKATSTPQP